VIGAGASGMSDGENRQKDVIARRVREAGERAQAEADARRKAAAPAAARKDPKEENGRDGPEPVRYGDWEINGIAVDF
jgi:hypothetical protein